MLGPNTASFDESADIVWMSAYQSRRSRSAGPAALPSPAPPVPSAGTLLTRPAPMCSLSRSARTSSGVNAGMSEGESGSCGLLLAALPGDGDAASTDTHEAVDSCGPDAADGWAHDAAELADSRRRESELRMSAGTPKPSTASRTGSVKGAVGSGDPADSGEPCSWMAEKEAARELPPPKLPCALAPMGWGDKICRSSIELKTAVMSSAAAEARMRMSSLATELIDAVVLLRLEPPPANRSEPSGLTRGGGIPS
mmetsp:Transcript_23887/g.77139  ORF Transcript_23887/g.77139 Transcript_23887/m.77139 type:complete len:254 (+) Transcript_23887:1230-1991(+)